MLDILFWISTFTAGTMFLLLVLSLVGGLDFDFDLDSGGDLDIEDGGGLGVIKSVLIFVSATTWVIRLLLIANNSTGVSIAGGVACGVLVVYLFSKFIAFFLLQTEDNSWTMDDALYSHGKVYLKIPNDGNNGIVQVKIHGAMQELKAITKDTKEIPTGSEVYIIETSPERVVVTINQP